MRKTWLTVVCTLLFALAAAGADARSPKPKPTPAPTPAGDDAAAAMNAYKKATKHYNLNEFEEAITAYREAYRLKSDPAFLFNIAQSYRQLGDYETAIKFYKSYLRDAPKAANRKDVETKIDEMKKALEARTSPPTDPIGSGTGPEPVDGVTTVDDPEGEGGTGKVPDPTDAVQKVADEDTAGTPPLVDSGGGGGSVLKKWWFWTAIGVVVVGGTAVAIASSGGGGGGTDIPDTTLGDQHAF